MKHVFRHPQLFTRLLQMLVLLLLVSALAVNAPASAQTSLRFAVIGDYSESQGAADVSNLIRGWNPDLIITVGDNNYPDGEASTIDRNIGQYYHDFISPYVGSYGAGATTNRFFPSLGNHDWNTTGAQPYLNYFTLPGNERYYDFVRGPVHFFVLDSDIHEPDGFTSTSTQGNWLRTRLAASTARWKLVYFHHPPYSSGTHGQNTFMQWPFAAWGASAVLSGHDHTYERIVRDGIPYFVNGLGGRSIYSFGTPTAGSQVRYNGDYGAMLVEADSSTITFKFINRSGALIDSYTPGVSPSSIIFQDGVTPDTSYAGTRDAYISQNDPTTNFGSATTLRMDGDEPSGRDLSMVMKWDTSALPAGKTVLSAQIILNVVDASPQVYEVYEMKRNWTEGDITWNVYAAGSPWQSAGATGTSDRGALILGSVTAWMKGGYQINLNANGVALVQRWINTPATNFGIMIADTANSDDVQASSREVSTPASRPQLLITYR